MRADPEREAEAKKNLGVLLDSASAMTPTGIVLIGGDDGPVPYEPVQP